MALINCPKCNREISEKARVCPGCGCALREPASDPPKPEVVHSPKGGDHAAPCPACGKQNGSKPQTKSFSISGAVGGFLLGAVLGFVLWFFWGATWWHTAIIGALAGAFHDDFI